MKTENGAIVLYGVITLLLLSLLWCLFVFKTNDRNGDEDFTRVPCGEGKSLADAVSDAKPGQTFLVEGTCNEGKAVQITEDGITIIGGEIIGGSDNPAILVTGRDATIKGSTVRDSLYGVLLVRNGSVRLEQVIARNNIGPGFCQDGRITRKDQYTGKSPSFSSACETKDSDNGYPKTTSRWKPFSVFGEAIAQEECTETLTPAEICGGNFSDKNTNGIEVVCGTLTITCPDKVVTINENTENGLLVRNGSTIGVYSNIEAKENSLDGIRVTESSMTVANVVSFTAQGNKRDGIVLNRNTPTVVFNSTVTSNTNTNNDLVVGTVETDTSKVECLFSRVEAINIVHPENLENCIKSDDVTIQ